ncbi:MAG: MFS transporter [Elusimicrobia bacterium]|nr:MFS transporter [Elusimicrobiota bacterium]
MADIYEIPVPAASRPFEGLDRLYVFFIAVYLAEGLVGVAYEPISYLLKDVLGLGAAQAAAFVAWMTLPFLFKPVLGVVTDALPLGGRRRVPWLFFASAATCAAWGALAALPSYRYGPTLALLVSVNVGIVFCDVLCDAVMVQRGKEKDKTGLYQAVQIGTLYGAALATGLGGGWLAQHASYRVIFGLTALMPALVGLGTWFVPEALEEPGAAKRAAGGVAALLKDPRAWALAAVIFLVDFMPFEGTAFFYFQSEGLHFSKMLIGLLNTVDGVSGLVGAALFWRFYNRTVTVGGKPRRLDPQRLVRVAAVATIPMTLAYMAYRGPATAVVLTFLVGTGGVAARLSLMDLAARTCPKHLEAAAFALFMSVFNLSAWASNTLGAAAYGRLSPHGALDAMAVLVAVSAACSALALPLLRYIPPSLEPA